MADFKLIYQRLSDIALTSTGENTSYPRANLKSYFPFQQWRDLATSSPPRYLNIDVGAVAAVAGIDHCVIHNCNFDTLRGTGGAVSLEAADNAGYSTNLVTVVVDLDGDSGIRVHTFTAVNKRYWRIKFATVISEVPKLGNIFLTKAFPLVYRGGSHDYGYKQGDSQHDTVEATAIDGTLRASASYLGRRVYEYPFTLLTDSVAGSFRTFHDTVRGNLFPFYLSTINSTVDLVKLTQSYNPVTIERYDQGSIGNLSMKSLLAEVY